MELRDRQLAGRRSYTHVCTIQFISLIAHHVPTDRLYTDIVFTTAISCVPRVFFMYSTGHKAISDAGPIKYPVTGLFYIPVHKFI